MALRPSDVSQISENSHNSALSESSLGFVIHPAPFPLLLETNRPFISHLHC
jgi:hypothetical protein